MNIGIIGCGIISQTYFNSYKIYNNFNVIACADIDHELAEKKAKEYNIISQTVDEIFKVTIMRIECY